MRDINTLISKFDNKYIKKSLVDFESDRGCQVIFGTMIGSCSQGLNNPTSDLDVRFLFLGRNLDVIEEKNRHKEERIRFQIHDKTKKCNCIALWEISAFLNFIYEPYIDRGTNYKLIRNVIWTFGSDFIFDPLGLRQEIFPLIEQSIDLQSEFEYHLNEMKKNEVLWQEKPLFRSLVYSLYHGLSCYWIITVNSIPPIHFRKLLKSLFPEHYYEVAKLVEYSNQNVDFYPNRDEVQFVRTFTVWLSEKVDDRKVVDARHARRNLLPEMVETIRAALVAIDNRASWWGNDGHVFKMLTEPDAEISCK